MFSFKSLGALLCATTITTGIAVAADPHPPTVISPTAASAPNGIAPNGLDATLGGIFFTQPFAGAEQTRGIYSITTGGVVSSVAPIPPITILPGVENAVSIAPGLLGSGFTAGDTFASGVSVNNSTKDAVYKNCSSIPFIDNIPATISEHQTGLGFDTVGSFGGALIVTADTTISLYNFSGTKLATYNGPAGFALQASTVAPAFYPPCPGCIFTTGIPVGDINNGSASGTGIIVTIAPGALDGSSASLFLSSALLPSPESIQFVTNNSLSCTVGGLSYFASGYATDGQINNTQSTSGAILGWAPGQLSSLVGQFLIQNEEIAGGGHGDIYSVDASKTLTLFSDTTSSGNSVGYQLEDTAFLQCKGGCPATFGFYKHFGLPSAMPLTIGGHLYTLSGLQNVLTTNPSGGNAVIILAHQLIAAIANYAAGATQTVQASQAILAAETLLASNSLVMGSSNVPASTPLGQQLTAVAGMLDNYNSATGLNCSEGSGLVLN
jgi:hypothetical protein